MQIKVCDRTAVKNYCTLFFGCFKSFFYNHPRLFALSMQSYWLEQFVVRHVVGKVLPVAVGDIR